MTDFDLGACFLVLIGTAGWLNARFVRLPTAAIMLFTGLVGAALLLGLARLGSSAAAQLITAIRQLDFTKAVLGYLLAFLLFAGATQVDLPELRRRFIAVFTLATLGVAASILIVSVGLMLGAHILGLPLALPWAVAFGALISPTDPIAVLAAVREGTLSKSLEAVLQGEALFNDGVGIVAFAAASAFVASAAAPPPLRVLGDVTLSTAGGLVLGSVAAFLTIRAIRSIDDYTVEVGITLALAAGSYALAQALHVSGPIAVVAAGLLFGDRGVRTAMSETTQRYVRGFWTLVDEILNALLFLLLGLELLVVPINLRLAGLWSLAIALVIIARLIVVLPWGLHFNAAENRRGAGWILSWGGLHGALSLALALSLPTGGSKGLVLSTTFAVVVFSVLVQGLSFSPLVRRFMPAPLE